MIGSPNVFCTNFFQQFFPVEKDNKLLIGQNVTIVMNLDCIKRVKAWLDHHMFSPIFCTNFFSTIFLSLASWKSNHNKYYIIFREKICRLGIQDSWNYLMSQSIEVICKFVLQDRNSISVCTLIITSNHLERNQGPKYLLFTPSELSSKDQNQWRKTKPIFVIRPERNQKKIK